MPLMRCEDGGRPGWKWGDAGKCYVYTPGDEQSEKDARDKALAQAAAMGEFPGTGARSLNVEVLERADAAVLSDAVDFKQRIIDIIAVPWGQEAEVVWRGEVWREVFERGAFNGIEDHAGRVPVNREHVRGDTVGKVVRLDPYDERGLIASVRIARTARGDETLQLASEDMLGASVGYYVKKGSDVELNRRSMLRRVKRAFLEHLAMTEIPAFAGAVPLAVRGKQETSGQPVRATPGLDAFLNDDVLNWARGRVGR